MPKRKKWRPQLKTSMCLSVYIQKRQINHQPLPMTLEAIVTIMDFNSNSQGLFNLQPITEIFGNVPFVDSAKSTTPKQWILPEVFGNPLELLKCECYQRVASRILSQFLHLFRVGRQLAVFLFNSLRRALNFWRFYSRQNMQDMYRYWNIGERIEKTL